MKITCIADLHGNLPKLKGGDLLIVAGDLTARDTQAEIDKVNSWLAVQSYRKKIFIAGNHDMKLINEVPKKYMWGTTSNITEKFEYLCDSGTEFEGLKIWGVPWTLKFKGINPRCTAFTGDEKDLKEKFNLVPDDTDILVCHGPPYGILDECDSGHVGSISQRQCWERVRPKLMVFGHIHEMGGGEMEVEIAEDTIHTGRKLINCSYVNEYYKPVNKPMEIEL